MNFELGTNICSLFEAGCPGMVLVGTNSYRPFDYVDPVQTSGYCTHIESSGRIPADRATCSGISDVAAC